MSSIDERIVEMQFNNAQFERGVKQTTDSLGKLKSGLKLDGAADSLDDLQSAGNKFSLGHLADGVETMASKFSTLGVVGVAALATITASAVNTGLQMAKSLVIAPISDGFADYNAKLTSVQTIMNATGESIKTVGGYFSQLDTYADKTIYNLSDMTGAFAKFTNAGIDMDKSVPAIKGIANMVALAGQDAGAASIAMYNLSQSMAGGFLTTTDYKSLNLANVATKEWKDQMIQGAVAAGTLKKSQNGMYNIKGSDKAYTSAQLFNEQLSEGWASTKVLVDVLGKYGDTNTAIGKKAQAAAQDVKSFSMMMDTLGAAVGTGWTDTFEIIIGNIEESKALFTPLTNAISNFLGGISNARNKVLKDWKTLGGRDLALDAFSNAFKALVTVIKPVQDAFKEIFPATTGKQLFAITQAIHTFSENLKIGGTTANQIKRTFAGVFAVLDIGRMVIVQIVKTLAGLFTTAGQGAGSFLSVTSSIGDFLVALRNAIKNGDGLQKFFEGLGAVLSIPIRILGTLIAILGGVANSFDGAFDGISGKVKPLSAGAAILTAAWEKFGAAVSRIWNYFQPIATALGGFFSNLGKMIADSIQTGDFSQVLDTINTGLLGGIVLLLTKMFKSGFNLNVDVGGGIFGSIKEIFEGLTGTLQAMQTKLKAQTLITIAGAVGILTLSVVALSLIDSAGLTRALTAITLMFTQLGVALAVFQKIAIGPGMAKLPILAASLILLGIAIDVLASAVVKLSGVDWNGLAKGLTGVTVLLGVLAGTAKLMKTSAANLIPAGLGMIAIAAAVNILATAVGRLGSMDVETLAKGLGAVALTLGTIAGFSHIINPKSMISTGIALTLLGAALNIIAQAVGTFAALSVEDLGKGLIGMAVALGVIAGAMALMPGPSLILTGAGLVIVGAALNVIAQAMTTFGGMTWDEIGAGLTVLAGTLVILAGALALMTGALPGAAALIVAAGALAIIAPVMTAWGAMDWQSIGKSMVVLAGSLLIIAGALYLMTAALPGAAALIVAAGALAILAPVMQVLGSMSWDEIGRGLTVLAAALGILAIAGALMTPFILTLMGLGVAIALVGAGMALAGVGVLAFAAGLTALGAAGAVGAVGLTVVFSAILGLIPLALEKLGEGVVALAGVIENGAPAIVNALVAVFSSLIDAIGTIVPKIIKTLVGLVVMMANTLATNVPKLVAAGLKLLLGVLDGIGNNIEKIITAGANIVVNFLNGIGKNLQKVIDAGLDLIVKFVNGLAEGIKTHTKAMQDAGLKLGFAIVDGMTGGMASKVKDVISAAGDLGRKALDAAAHVLDSHSPSREFEKLGAYSVDGYVLGLTGNIDKIKDAFGDMKDLLKDLLDSSTKDIDDYKKKIEDLNYTHGQDNKAISDQRAALNDAKARRAAGTDVIDEKQKLQELTKSRSKDTREIKQTQKALSATDKKHKLTDKQRQAAQDRLEDLTDARTKDNYEIAKQKKVLEQARKDRKSGTDVKDEQDKLNKLIHTRNENNQALKDTKDSLKTAQDEQTKANAATEIYNQQLAQNKAQLEDWAQQDDDLTDQIKKQTQAVEDATKTRDDYNRSLTDSYSTMADISKDTNVDDYFGKLEDQVAKTNEFSSDIQELRRRGLNDDNYKKLLGEGVESLPFVQQLLDKGDTGIQEFNSLSGQLDKAASGIGSAASSSLYQAGVDSAQGLLDGLKSKQTDIQAQMTAMANTMTQAIKDALGIHSPSRVFAEVGGYSIDGLVGGLKAGSGTLSSAAEGVGNTAVDALRKSMSGITTAVATELDFNPSIRPVLDLSAIQSGAGQIGGMLGRPVMSVDTTADSAASAYDGYTANQQAILDSKSDYASERGGDTIFNQNNYSPKPLSSIEIYRQTKNQLSQVKGDN